MSTSVSLTPDFFLHFLNFRIDGDACLAKGSTHETTECSTSTGSVTTEHATDCGTDSSPNGSVFRAVERFFESGFHVRRFPDRGKKYWLLFVIPDGLRDS